MEGQQPTSLLQQPTSLLIYMAFRVDRPASNAPKGARRFSHEFRPDARVRQLQGPAGTCPRESRRDQIRCADCGALADFEEARRLAAKYVASAAIDDFRDSFARSTRSMKNVSYVKGDRSRMSTPRFIFTDLATPRTAVSWPVRTPLPTKVSKITNRILGGLSRRVVRRGKPVAIHAPPANSKHQVSFYDFLESEGFMTDPSLAARWRHRPPSSRRPRGSGSRSSGSMPTRTGRCSMP